MSDTGIRSWRRWRPQDRARFEGPVRLRPARRAFSFRRSSFLLYRSIRAGAQRDRLLLTLAACIGALVGLCGYAFHTVVERMAELFSLLFEASANYPFSLALIPLVPAVGGLLVGLVDRYIFRTGRGHGIPEIIQSLIISDGVLRPITIPQKMLTAALSIGSGGGGGREGPIVQIGSAIGSSVGQALRFGPDRMRTLVACGAAAAISTIFNAPLGGVMFALEVILGEFSVRTFSPVIVASVVATAVGRAFFGNATALVAPTFHLQSNGELVLYSLLGVLLGGVAIYFIRSLYWCEDQFKARTKWIPHVLQPAFGGLLAGVLVAFVPQLLEINYEAVNQTFAGHMPLWVLIAVIVLKPFSVGLTVGSGGTGGAFAPALKVGAMAGALFGIAVGLVFPGVTADPGSYALVGTGAMLGAVLHAPITGILFLYEVTGSYETILPLMLSTILALTVAQRYLPASVYTMALERMRIRFHNPINLNRSANIRVADLMSRRVVMVRPNTPFLDIVRHFRDDAVSMLIVTNDREQFVGCIDFRAVRPELADPDLPMVVIAADLIDPATPTVHAGQPLEEALSLFEQSAFPVLPVMSEADPTRVVGLLDERIAFRHLRRSILTAIRPHDAEG